ncbi:TldD/PmbA family protein [Acidiferrimicrobium sp. IK]|uniref:TldD/PmbA family protein n=1 Tax=Acidiferrimicrobium sp. IK TaxID=2871700 RepID=UPI0021CB681D|nr:TldD/PmbA family protein [Acidiferrimicrobium sp. IK]MCU4185354.1 TldD/PmbA family protein [Acidiferrimicrobium sp. IK]
MSAGELSELAERVAGWARDGEQVEAFVARGRDTEIQVYSGEVESLSSAESAGIGIRVVAGGRQGFAYAGSLAADVVEETLAEARDNAGFASPDEWVGLAVPDGVVAADLDLWRDDLAAFATADKVSLALDLEKAVRAGDPRIRQVESAEWGDGAYESAIATSTGIRAAWRRTVCYVSAQAVAGEGSETQTASGYSVGRGPGDIDLAKAASDAVERSTRLLGATKPRSGHLTVVFEPRITATLLALIAGTLDGEAVLKGRSLFGDRLGQAVAAPSLTLVDDPTDPDAYGATAYDAEGLATRRNALIEGGVLEKFLYNTYSARRAGTVSTASAVRAGFKSGPGTGARALSVLPGATGPDEILASVGDGLLVQSVSGLHSGVNPVSGDFSVGAEGMLIEGGAIGRPVRELTIASTLQRMLQDIVAIGNDIERLPSSATGVTLAIADVSMSGA